MRLSALISAGVRGFGFCEVGLVCECWSFFMSSSDGGAAWAG